MNSALGSSWKQARQEIFSPEEIAASDERVKKIVAKIKAEREKSMPYKASAKNVEIQPVATF